MNHTHNVAVILIIEVFALINDGLTHASMVFIIHAGYHRLRKGVIALIEKGEGVLCGKFDAVVNDLSVS